MSKTFPESFDPRVWDKDLLVTLRQYLEHPYGNPEMRRKGHAEVTPYTDTELQARDEAVADWQKLTEELEAKGYLERGACYECAGELEPVTETEHHEWVHDETVEEHQARVNPTGEATVTFKVV